MIMIAICLLSYRVFEVNVKAVFNVSQVVAKCMVEQKIAGSIVNVSSQVGQITYLVNF